MFERGALRKDPGGGRSTSVAARTVASLRHSNPGTLWVVARRTSFSVLRDAIQALSLHRKLVDYRSGI